LEKLVIKSKIENETVNLGEREKFVYNCSTWRNDWRYYNVRDFCVQKVYALLWKFNGNDIVRNSTHSIYSESENVKDTWIYEQWLHMHPQTAILFIYSTVSVFRHNYCHCVTKNKLGLQKTQKGLLYVNHWLKLSATEKRSPAVADISDRTASEILRVGSNCLKAHGWGQVVHAVVRVPIGCQCQCQS